MQRSVSTTAAVMRFRPGESAHVRTSEWCVLYCTEHACMCSTVALCIMFKYHIAHALLC